MKLSMQAVKRRLDELGVEYEQSAKYTDLCKVLKAYDDQNDAPSQPVIEEDAVIVPEEPVKKAEATPLSERPKDIPLDERPMFSIKPRGSKIMEATKKEIRELEMRGVLIGVNPNYCGKQYALYYDE